MTTPITVHADDRAAQEQTKKYATDRIDAIVDGLIDDAYRRGYARAKALGGHERSGMQAKVCTLKNAMANLRVRITSELSSGYSTSMKLSVDSRIRDVESAIEALTNL